FDVCLRLHSVETTESGDQSVRRAVERRQEHFAMLAGFEMLRDPGERDLGQIADGKRLQLVCAGTGGRGHGFHYLAANWRTYDPILTPRRYRRANLLPPAFFRSTAMFLPPLWRGL